LAGNVAASNEKNLSGADDSCQHGLDLSFEEGKLHGVIGRVGSGKSSLLLALLGEPTLTKGTLAIDGSIPIAYVPQQPWIINASVRDNVLMGSVYEKSRYDAVMSACALDSDLKRMQHGDATELGERGITVSGGQKLRVALARACYSTAALVLLDDPLASVDAHVGAHIYQSCIRDFLLKQGGRTVIMTTHAMHTVNGMDNVVLIDEGKLVAQGPPAEVAKADHPLAQEINQELRSPPDIEEETAGLEEVMLEATGVDGAKGVNPKAEANTVMVTEKKQMGEVTWGTFTDCKYTSNHSWINQAPEFRFFLKDCL